MGYSFSKELLEQLKKCDLVQYFKSRFPDIPIHRSGDYYVARCPHPDHDDENPSFRIHRDMQTGWYSWTCFSCHNGKKGDKMPTGKINRGTDAIAFVIWLSDYNGSPHILTFQEAVLTLLKFFHIPLPTEKKNPLQKHELLNQILAEAFVKGLSGSAAEAYAFSRGLSKNTLHKFHIGTDGDRLAIPLTDYEGRIQGFNYRHIHGEDPKYIHSSARDGFIKSRYLFGMEHINPSSKHVFLTEGCMDVMLADQYGVQNTVACLGTAFQDSHVELLKNHHIQSVSIVFDGDEKGQCATTKAIDLLRKQNLSCNVIVLPEQMDLCDFSLKHKEETSSMLPLYTVPDFEYLLRKFATMYQEQKRRIQQQYMPTILEQAAIFTRQEELDLFRQYVFDEFDIRLEKEYARKAKENMEHSVSPQTAA